MTSKKEISIDRFMDKLINKDYTGAHEYIAESFMQETYQHNYYSSLVFIEERKFDLSREKADKAIGLCRSNNEIFICVLLFADINLLMERFSFTSDLIRVYIKLAQINNLKIDYNLLYYRLIYIDAMTGNFSAENFNVVGNDPSKWLGIPDWFNKARKWKIFISQIANNGNTRK